MVETIKNNQNIILPDMIGAGDESIGFPDANLLHHNQMAEVLKELFDERKIFMIGDLTPDEVKLATRIYMLSELKDMPEWKEGLKIFIELLLSKRRESRKEIIDAIKGISGKKTLGERIKNVFKPDEY